MGELYVVMIDTRLVGVYTSHRKAMQTVIMDTVRSNLKLVNYLFDFGVEFLTYEDEDGNETHFEIQEIIPDARA